MAQTHKNMQHPLTFSLYFAADAEHCDITENAINRSGQFAANLPAAPVSWNLVCSSKKKTLDVAELGVSEQARPLMAFLPYNRPIL